MSNGNQLEHLERLEQFLQQDPENVTLRAEAAMVAVEVGLAARAARLLADPPGATDAPKLLHASGFVALATHRFEDAVAIFDALIESGTNTPSIRFNGAYARFRRGDLGGAETRFRALIDAGDAPVQALAYLVRSIHGQARAEDAIGVWDAAPGPFRTAQTGGVVSLAALDANRPEDARRLAVAALAAPEPPPEAMVVLATLMVGAGEIVGAEKLLDQALRLVPDDGRVLSAVGAAALLGGQVDRAEQAFSKACEALPGHVGSWVTLAWCQILRQDFVSARESIEAAIRLDRNFPEAHGAMAVIDAFLGQSHDAERSITKALRLDRKSMSARYAQAILQGEASSRHAVQALALRLLQGRPGAVGTALLERAVAAAGRDGMQPTSFGS